MHSETKLAPKSAPSSLWISRAIFIFGSVFLIALYSSFTRPIWIDEFLHFALGSHRSFSEVFETISDTVPTFNHGQTGTYMVIDYVILKTFGANAHWLRLPSILAGFFLLYAAYRGGRIVGFGPAFMALLLLTFAGQKHLMYYVGEARPYMPLAAATMGTLAYYLQPAAQRKCVDTVVGALAIFSGVLFHPYFPLYWLALAVFTFCIQRPAYVGVWVTFKSFIAHCNPFISVPATLAFFVVAKVTWLRGSQEFDFDPFQWIKNDGLVNTFTKLSHFQFLGEFTWPTLIVVGLLTLASLLPGLKLAEARRRLVAPLCLITLALGISLFLSWVSYRRDYWVLPRQWVASDALVCFGFAWICFEITRYLNGLLKFSGIIIIGLFIWVCSKPASINYRQYRSDMMTFLGLAELPETVSDEPPPTEPQATPANNDEWVAAANANIRAGGPVWAVFRRYYGKGD